MRTALDPGAARPGDHDDHGARPRARRAAASSPASGWRWRSRSPSKAPAESLRYARFLMQDDRHRPGRGRGGRRAAPRARRTASCCSMLGQIHLARRDWTRADQVAALLREQDGPEADGDGGRPRDREPARPGPRPPTRSPRSRGSPAPDGGDVRAMADLMQGYVEAGDLAAAQRYLDGVLAAGSGERAGAADAGRARPARGRPRRRRGRLPRGDRRRPGRCRRRYQALYALPRRPGPRRRGARPRSTPGSPRRRDSAPARLRQGRAPRGPGRHRRRDRRLRDALRPRQRLAGARQQPREPDRQLPRRPGEPRARLRHRPAAARLGACRSSRTPTAGSCTAAATTTRRSATSPRPPRRCPTTRWCSSTSPRPSSRSSRRAEARASFARALAAAEAGSPLPQLEAARARIAEIDEAARGG